MLAKEPERRYQLVHDVRTNLTQVLSQTAPSQRDEPTVGRVKRGLWPALAMLALILVACLGWWLFRGETTVTPGKITSIAVLPLENLMGDPEQDYFVEGMHEALITNLSKIKALKVISRTSVMRYRERDMSIPEIADELGVDAVIGGSVLRAGNRVRITAQLIHGTTDEHLWAESYERDLSDVLSLQGEVARAVAQEIRIEVTPQEEKRLVSSGPIKDEAYLSYLKGRYFLDQRSAAAARRANEHFKQALEKDPDSALAYAGLADSYVFLDALEGRAKKSLANAKAAVAKALELDDSLAEAYTSMGMIRGFHEWDWSAAERELKRALELNPGYAEAHSQYGELLSVTGRSEEGIAETTLALGLDPLSPLRNADLVSIFVLARQYDRAIEQGLKTVDLFPNYKGGPWHLGWAYFNKGMYQEAIAAFKSVSRLGHPLAKNAIAQVHAMQGDPTELRALIEELLIQRSGATYVSPGQIAHLYAVLGEKEQAFAWLETAYEEHDGLLFWVKVWAVWDSLRDDPRFTDLLRRMGLER